MIVSVNGDARELPAGSSVADAVALVSPVAANGRGYAVAVAGEVVPRGEWATTELVDGAQVEVLAAIQGG